MAVLTEELVRDEVRAWLQENWDPDLTVAQWWDRLAESGWAMPQWPEEWFGRGLSGNLARVASDEIRAAGAIGPPSGLGVLLAAPTILTHGTDEQKQRYLRPILNGEEGWCQLFSEPGAGSDLASLQCKAERDGDEWVINGQKVWTTQAKFADYIFLLARTDPSASKHAGISYLLVPMKQEGVEVRPIIQPDGSGEFNEVFFNNARCPKDNVVGGLNNGWKVAMTTLGFERGTSATTGYRRFERELQSIIDKARANGRIGDPTVRQGLARAWCKVQIMKVNGWRSLSAEVTGKKDMSVAALGATNKMYWSEYHREVMELAMDILGMEGQVLAGTTDDDEPSMPGMARRHALKDYPVTPLQASFFFSRSETIWGGTAEIQRNIVGERVLGLPKEPKAPEPAKSST